MTGIKQIIVSYRREVVDYKIYHLPRVYICHNLPLLPPPPSKKKQHKKKTCVLLIPLFSHEERYLHLYLTDEEIEI